MRAWRWVTVALGTIVYSGVAHAGPSTGVLAVPRFSMFLEMLEQMPAHIDMADPEAMIAYLGGLHGAEIFEKRVASCGYNLTMEGGDITGLDSLYFRASSTKVGCEAPNGLGQPLYQLEIQHYFPLHPLGEPLVRNFCDLDLDVSKRYHGDNKYVTPYAHEWDFSEKHGAGDNYNFFSAGSIKYYIRFDQWEGLCPKQIIITAFLSTIADQMEVPRH
ncbi:hypothetical protein FBZ90_1064 [Nitrospirillum pindoramense]|uniref:Uncharacterized protein n=1 Tax=Nitrospirillum amazonense TaxID=28077 RepID=A0A560HAA0_9PROT|nr:hypothetical protein FBZ90_1064 [Nitrospirillum amazonense]